MSPGPSELWSKTHQAPAQALRLCLADTDIIHLLCLGRCLRPISTWSSPEEPHYPRIRQEWSHGGNLLLVRWAGSDRVFRSPGPRARRRTRGDPQRVGAVSEPSIRGGRGPGPWLDGVMRGLWASSSWCLDPPAPTSDALGRAVQIPDGPVIVLRHCHS